MAATTLPLQSAPSSTTTVRHKLFDIFVSPTEVFDEIIASPANLANWRVPTFLACLAGVISLQLGGFPAQSASAIAKLTESGTISTAQAQALAGLWPLLSALSICLATFAGSCWSAFVLWFIGRTFLKVRFPYIKSLEIVGLTSIISVLGLITSILLTGAVGDPSARPALSLLAAKLDHSRPFYQVLEIFNFFHLWSVTVLAIGLSRLCNVAYKEAAFWIFGSWVAARIVLLILQ